jgi:hypothetical protein
MAVSTCGSIIFSLRGIEEMRFSPMMVVLSCACLCGCAKVESQAAKEGAEMTTEIASKEVGPFLERSSEAIEAAFLRQRLSWVLEGGAKAVFKAFETVQPKSRWKIFTSSDVKQFIRLFEAGAREPERYFNDPKVDQVLLARWVAAPMQDRVFLAGSQEDSALVGALRMELEKEGKVVFFYRFCAGTPGELCASSTVGAFFGTAGGALVAVTPGSTESRYVPSEIAAAIKVNKNEKSLLLLTPRDAINAAASSSKMRIFSVVIPQIPITGGRSK